MQGITECFFAISFEKHLFHHIIKPFWYPLYHVSDNYISYLFNFMPVTLWTSIFFVLPRPIFKNYLHSFPMLVSLQYLLKKKYFTFYYYRYSTNILFLITTYQTFNFDIIILWTNTVFILSFVVDKWPPLISYGIVMACVLLLSTEVNHFKSVIIDIWFDLYIFISYCFNNITFSLHFYIAPPGYSVGQKTHVELKFFWNLRICHAYR